VGSRSSSLATFSSGSNIKFYPARTQFRGRAAGFREHHLEIDAWILSQRRSIAAAITDAWGIVLPIRNSHPRLCQELDSPTLVRSSSKKWRSALKQGVA